MSPEKKAELKLIIEDLIQSLTEECASLKERTKPIPPSEAIGRLTRMEAISEREVLLATMKQAQLRLDRLNNALQRINDDSFGMCLECDEEVPWARLKIIPEGQICIECLKESAN